MMQSGDGREFLRGVNAVADEIVDSGVIGSGMTFLGSRMGLVVGSYQYQHMAPLGDRVASVMVGQRIVRFRFLPEPDKG